MIYWFIMAIWATSQVFVAGETDVRRDATVTAVERVMPSVVNISTETIVERRDDYDELLQEFWGPYYRRRTPEAQYSLGSGVIIDEAGYVLTNFHVVQRANRIWVRLADPDGRVFEAEPVAGTRQSDVAVLKLKSKPGDKFAAARFAVGDDLLLGETVLALGNPFGLGGSVTRGILSSKSRRPPSEKEPLDIADWLQTDAAINPGNSGGPLINLKGEIIGINVAVFKEGQGIGFAIPIRRVSEAVAEIYSPEVLRGLWFGARIAAGRAPLKVTEVQPGSPASKAGLRTNDLVLSINGHVPERPLDLGRELVETGQNKPVELVVQRGNERLNLTVRLVPENTVFTAEVIRQRTGASVQELNPKLAEGLGLSIGQGLVVAGVDRNSPVAIAGIKNGFVIQGIDGQATPDIVSAARLLFSKSKGEKVQLNLVVERVMGSFIQRQNATVAIQLR